MELNINILKSMRDKLYIDIKMEQFELICKVENLGKKINIFWNEIIKPKMNDPNKSWDDWRFYNLQYNICENYLYKFKLSNNEYCNNCKDLKIIYGNPVCLDIFLIKITRVATWILKNYKNYSDERFIYTPYQDNNYHSIKKNNCFIDDVNFDGLDYYNLLNDDGTINTNKIIFNFRNFNGNKFSLDLINGKVKRSQKCIEKYGE